MKFLTLASLLRALCARLRDLCVLLCLASCSSPPPPAAPALLSSSPSTLVESVDPWTYNNKPGRIITTANFHLYTTESDSVLITRLPHFLEAALSHYRGILAPLPPPPGRLDTFLMPTRPDWARLTRQLMGAQAEIYLRIPRGGFAAAGRAIYFDIGAHDTLAIAAHEGWHQYVQRTFHDPLPVWLDEGIATFMEGHRWAAGTEGGGGPTAVFLPWSNTERFDQLRAAAARGDLFSLQDLLTKTPQDLIDSPVPRGGRGSTTDPALTYYAQLWALAHFLHEAENAKYARPLAMLLADAAEPDHRFRIVIATSLGASTARTALASRRGPAAFLAYFNSDLTVAAAEYARFVDRLVQPGSRGPIVEGRSPFDSNR